MWEKKLEWIFGLAVLVVVAILANGRFLPAGSEAKGGKKKTVVIDAGHGGVDPGKIGVNDAKEKEINLKIAQYLKEALEEKGIAVVMTREDDNGLYSEGSKNKKREDLQKRCAIIEETAPEAVISIHQNSYHGGGERGSQVFYYTGSEEGKKLAECIQQALVERLKPEKPRGTKANDSYYMLRNTAAPTVIVECGFLSNWEEAQKLITEEYQQKVAKAVAEGALAYLD